jgi:predicted lipid-binding transport protein (Tim44 family)
MFSGLRTTPHDTIPLSPATGRFHAGSRPRLRSGLQGLIAVFAVALGVALAGAPFTADAKRIGGGSSVGRQSSNVMPRTAAPAPVAPSSSTTAPAPAAAGGASSPATASAAKPAAASPSEVNPALAAPSPARPGSRWLGPIAGIAAGLGLGMLLSHLGLSGAFAEFLSSALLVALVAFAVIFLVRRLFGAAPRPLMQAAGGVVRREADAPAPVPSQAFPSQAAPAALPRLDAPGEWGIPGGFDTAAFLQEAKVQFTNIQSLWDAGDLGHLREYLTDDLVAEVKPQLDVRSAAPGKTEVVLLNAELLGIEIVPDGHLVSVRYSGMLREGAGNEAFRFEEVWNLFKPAQGGWLLAGIQQIPLQHAG